MAILGEETLQSEIKSKKLKKLYLIFGNDGYLKQYYCEKISAIACGGDPFFNLQKFEATSNLQDVYDAVKQYPMMADSKFVSLSDFDFAKCDAKDFEKLKSIITEVEDGCIFALVFDAVDFDAKRNDRAKKLISLIEKQGGEAVLLDHRTVPKLAAMLSNGANKRGCILSDSDAKYMIEKSGDDINILRNEIEKLCAFVKEGKITREIIDNVCTKTVDSSLYDFATYIISGDIESALKLLDDLFFMRVEALSILSSVSFVYIDILRLFEAQKSGVSMNAVAEDFDYGNRKFVLTKTLPKLKKFDKQSLLKSFSIITDADKALKSFSSDDRLILEKMTVDLIAVIRG
ncbi:MAG: DNA polymerase III subunit delta [Clostridia bacterium]|nr:DNA polymerase III subunit delta [Clostridia bacterium]